MKNTKIETNVGKPLDRVDGRLKVTGKAKYAAEYQLKDLSYAVLIQSTVSRGKIKNIDSSAAEKLAGVRLVLSYKNAPKIPAKPIADFDDSLHLLQDQNIYHDRQNIGIVVADSLETAAHAASLVKVEYEPSKCEVEMDAALSKARAPGSKKESGTKRGDWPKAIKTAAKTIEETYITPPVIHTSMETHSSTAAWDGDKLHIFESTQAIFNCRNKLAKAFGIPAENVRVTTSFLGGGFGTKLSTWSGTVLAAAAARICKRPVQLALSRANTYGGTGFRPRTVQKLTLGAGKDGKLCAIKHESSSENCRFADFVEDCADITTRLYSCPTVITNLKVVPLDISKPTWMRAPGECPGVYALESAMDELAYELNIDPLKFRMLNYAEKDEHENLPWSSKSLKECYEQGAAHFGWEKRKQKAGSMKRGNKLVGWGMATASHPTYRMKSQAKVIVNADGTAIVKSGTQDIGTGTYTIMSQIAADILDLPISMLRAELGDTEMPEAPMSGGSMTAASIGSAVQAAALKAVKELCELAIADKGSPLYGAQAADIQVREAGLYLKSQIEKGETFKELLSRNGGKAIEALASAAPDERADKYSKHSFGAHFAEVEVDPELCTIRVTRFVSAVGAGKIINPKTAGSQIKGGVIYGIGMALSEEIVRDKRSGRIINADLAEYHIPVHADIPNIEIIFVDENDSIINPIGAKGVGEIAVIGVAAAVANAVFHATGKRVRELPITLDKIL
ncbi:MAG: xanthine dehydrogenase family protein molybdopterin-binding subunit [Candidatus Obscuribacterales bacterium]|nr:xanthine dehydrogenase family protein molybdopterin-binding subunit [Candidatus Obscuribacterales bacterium]